MATMSEFREMFANKLLIADNVDDAFIKSHWRAYLLGTENKALKLTLEEFIKVAYAHGQHYEDIFTAKIAYEGFLIGIGAARHV